MKSLRNLISFRGPKALVLLLAALALHALVPVGHMVAATPGHGLAITMCPVTHPLARAAVEAEAEAGKPAMDHASMDHGSMDMAAVDHAAMGHVSSDDGTPVTAQGKSECAFSALGSATVDPGTLSLDPLLRVAAKADIPPLPDLAIIEADRLRPPLRAPPRLS